MWEIYRDIFFRVIKQPGEVSECKEYSNSVLRTLSVGDHKAWMDRKARDLERRLSGAARRKSVKPFTLLSFLAYFSTDTK